MQDIGDPAEYHDVLMIGSSEKQRQFKDTIPFDNMRTATSIGPLELQWIQDFFRDATLHRAFVAARLDTLHENGDIDDTTYNTELNRLLYGHRYLLLLEDTTVDSELKQSIERKRASHFTIMWQ